VKGTSGAAIAVAVYACLLSAEDSGERLLAGANAAYRALRAADAVTLYREYLARNPDRPDVRVFLGGALLNLGQLAAALDEANRAIALDAGYAKAYILAGRVSSAREQWDGAQRFYERAERLAPRDPEAWYFSGRAFYDANRFEPAVEAFQHALRTGGEQSRVYENLGLAKDALGEFAAAEKCLRKAVSLAGGAWRPYVAYGAFLYRQGRGAEALPLLRQAVALEPQSDDARFELARVLYQENNFAEAARVLEPALPAGTCRVRNLMARIDSAAGRNDAAEAQVAAMAGCKSAPEHP
jgi:tetratricopeptide (TPR) repeat protein